MFLIALYLAAIVAANLLVAAFGTGIVLVNAALFIAFDLTLRDRLHDRWEHKHLWRKMALLIFTGSLLSALLNWQAVTIATASFTAFACAGAVDALVYAVLDRQPQLVRMNGSNFFSALIDSWLFMYLAFGVFPGFWTTVLLQFIIKVVGGMVWSFILTRREWKYRS